jgi:serine/threonine-protein kinase
MCTDDPHRLTLRRVTAEPETITLQNGRYHCTKRLGSGQFGEVWYGRDFGLDTEVAVKLFDADVDLDPLLLQEQAMGVLRETQVMTKLRSSDRIVTVSNVGLEPPLPFISMEYMRNGSVGMRLDERRVNIAEAVRWAREGLDGLAFAHGLGVLHRDIKPDNLLLDNEYRAVLTDFGLAEDTVRGFFVNSAVYVPHAAPELFSGSASSVHSDIWAMGCTLYRLLTGDHTPFNDLSDAAAGKLSDPHTLNPQIPLSLTRVVRTALAPDPAERYRDARAMIDALIDCGIKHGWRRGDEDEPAEIWDMDAGEFSYELVLSPKKARGFRIEVKRDLGSGPRRCFKEDFDTIGRARQTRRQLLVKAVEGKSLV